MTAAATGALAAPTTDRVAGFDLLRGICALAVAAYHLLYWEDLAHLYTWGTYGVYIFFVLSGASMWVAYSEKFAAGYPVSRFLLLRLVRLCPLYMLAMLVILTKEVGTGNLTLRHLEHDYLNLFFLFGLGNPGETSRVTGGWSLGIEFVFYLLFPVALSLLSGKRWPWVLALAFTTQHVFIHGVLANGRGIVANWNTYTQFLAFIFYFAAGCLIGRLVRQGQLKESAWGLLPMVAALGIIGAASGNTSDETLIGATGIVLSVAAVLAVAASATVRLRAAGQWVSGILGKSSYGVYIFHPLLFKYVKRLAEALLLGTAGAIALTLGLALALSILLERHYEARIQGFFKRRTR